MDRFQPLAARSIFRQGRALSSRLPVPAVDYHYSSVERDRTAGFYAHQRLSFLSLYLTLRIRSQGNMANQLAAVESAWKKRLPIHPLNIFSWMRVRLPTVRVAVETGFGFSDLLNLLIVLMVYLAWWPLRWPAYAGDRRAKSTEPVHCDRAPVLREYGITILLANLIAACGLTCVIEKWLEHYPTASSRMNGCLQQPGEPSCCLAAGLIPAMPARGRAGIPRQP